MLAHDSAFWLTRTHHRDVGWPWCAGCREPGRMPGRG